MSKHHPNHTVRYADAKHIMKHHLEKLQGHSACTMNLHESVIGSLLSFLASRGRSNGKHLHVAEKYVVQWMVADVREKSNNYAASRLQVVDRYVELLYQHGLLEDNPLRRIKPEQANPSWNFIVDVLQAPQPWRRLAQLLPSLPRRGPLYRHIDKYIELHQSLGKKYRSHHQVLHNFDHFLAKQHISSPLSIKTVQVSNWLDSMSCTEQIKQARLHVVRRYMDYLVGIGVMKSNSAIPVAADFGRIPAKQFRPFIFTKAQVIAILKQARKLPPNHLFKLRPQTCHTMLVLLFALGLRSREVRNLRFCDVDMDQSVLFINNTKFHKSRMVPFGPKVRKYLRAYMVARRKILAPVNPEDPLFITYRRQPIGSSALGSLLRNLTNKVMPDVLPPPRIHDLRHSFAVHRLLRWYREGADVQSKLVLLSTFMGHTEINSTEVYLTITMELLKEANARFYQNCGKWIGKDIYK